MKFGLHERPTLGVAAVLVVGADGRVADARLAIGCVGPVRSASRAAEQRLRGMPVAEVVRRARRSVAERVAEAIDAVDDLHGSAEYKREMARVFVRPRARRQRAAARSAGRSTHAIPTPSPWRRDRSVDDRSARYVNGRASSSTCPRTRCCSTCCATGST